MWDANYNGQCEFTEVNSKETTTLKRHLDDYKFIIRDNNAIRIIEKCKCKDTLERLVKPISLFGLPTTTTCVSVESDYFNIKLYTSGYVGYMNINEIPTGHSYINSYTAMIGAATSGRANELDKNGQTKVLTSAFIKLPGEVCTQGYIAIGQYNSIEQPNNIVNYLKTKLVRFLLWTALSSIHISADKFCFVPLQNFTSNSDINWSLSISEIDQQLYKKYNLDQEEIGYIESTIKPMN